MIAKAAFGSEPGDSGAIPPRDEELLRRNVSAVRERIARACARARRPADSVRLAAVTKYVDAATCAALFRMGVTDFGESRVQQLVLRAGELGADLGSAVDSAAGPGGAPRWHLIGHLQRNKVKAALRASRTVHSLDSARLADALSAEAVAIGATVDSFLEVNLSGEASKSGASGEEAREIAEHASRLAGLRLRGLMTMAPIGDSDVVRPVFAGLRELLERWRASGVVGPQCSELSMGMTQDFETAVEEGATWVRVGSALYGQLKS